VSALFELSGQAVSEISNITDSGAEDANTAPCTNEAATNSKNSQTLKRKSSGSLPATSENSFNH
jgi:hypothetical protein